MSYEVELPDGTVVEDIPEGTTQAELVRRLQAAGHDTSWHEADAAPSNPRGPASSQGDLRASENAQAARGGPARRSLDERHALRGQFGEEDSTLAQAEVRLKKEISKLVFRRTPDDAPALQALRANLDSVGVRRGQLQSEMETLGVGQTGRIIGSTAGGTLGGIAGGALGAGAGPLGVVAGATGLGTAGSALGSVLGTKWDLARARDITEAEAKKLLDDQMAEDVIADGLGNVLFFGGGKLMKVTGASAALKRAAANFLGNPAAAPVVSDAVQTAQPVRRWSSESGKYVVPGQEGLYAKGLELVAGKTVSEQAASRVNQRFTQEVVAEDLGLPPGTEITEQVLKDVREQAGKAYAAVKALPIRIRADAEYKSALARLRGEFENTDFPGLEFGKATRKSIDGADMPEMSPKSLVRTVKDFRGQATVFARAGDMEAAKAHRELAEQLDGLLERSVDPEFVADLRAARTLIAKSHDVEQAMAGDAVNALKLGGTRSKKRPLSGGMAQASDFAQNNRKLVQTPSAIGADNPMGNVLTSGVLALAGLGGAGTAAYHDSDGLALGGLAVALGRPAGIALLKRAYANASKQGNKEVARHAARLLAMQRGAMTGAKMALFNESVQALHRAGVPLDGAEEE